MLPLSSSKLPCGSACRSSLAPAICAELVVRQGGPVVAPAVNGSSLLAVHAFAPVLLVRSAALLREFGCEVRDGRVFAPAVKPKVVTDGKSGSGFLVGGGEGVSADQPASYSVILKQLNPAEAALLPRLLPQLMERYIASPGSLLTRFYGWVRFADASRNGFFEALMMDNVARPPPGVSEGVKSRWSPFDMKGIRLYKNERRFESTFGRRGLRIVPEDFVALQEALDEDVALLSSRQLVDYSYLLTVVATIPSTPDACGHSRAWYTHSASRHAPSISQGTGRRSVLEQNRLSQQLSSDGRTAPQLVDACYCVNITAADLDAKRARLVTRVTEGTDSSSGATRGADFMRVAGEVGHNQPTSPVIGQRAAANPQSVLWESEGEVDEMSNTIAHSQMQTGALASVDVRSQLGSDDFSDGSRTAMQCERVLVRLAIIDYLREWKLVEIGEHVQKTLQRDLFARERNHAVVPVSQFARSFLSYFSDALFAPLPRQEVNLRIGIQWISPSTVVSRTHEYLVIAIRAMRSVCASIPRINLRIPRTIDRLRKVGEILVRSPTNQ
mmetsp:Transcript_30674/g.93886  ORF Transcript_30674/g.93886 Transcript_30674/m.93886 type:complete len:556 (-) Transcript_30674:180-1847(-)